MDSAPPHSRDRLLPSPSPDGVETLGGIQTPELQLKDLSGIEVHDLWREAEADSVGLGMDELATVLLTLGVKYNYGQPPGTEATRSQIADFWRSLQLRDLALAHACALGREPAWQQFMTRYRDILTQAAISITSSAALGCELADSLYADLFGLTERGEQRRSPLGYYSGRGSLKGFLRAVLAQRNVDHHRRSNRETPLMRARDVADSAGDLGRRSTAAHWHDGQITCRALTVGQGHAVIPGRERSEGPRKIHNHDRVRRGVVGL